jgi:hypothetical protein
MNSQLGQLVLTSLRPMQRTGSAMSRLCATMLQRLSMTLKTNGLTQSAAPAAASDQGTAIRPLPRSVKAIAFPKLSGRRSVVSGLAGLALGIAVTAVTAFVVAGKPWTSGADKSVDEASAFLSRFQGQTSGTAQPSSLPAPNLVANQAGPRRAGEAFPLGVSVAGPGDGALLVIGGFADGATMSAGQPTGDNRWRLSAAELNDAVIQPPRDFAGAMDLTIELRLADDIVADRRSLRFEWAEATVPEALPKAKTVRQVEPGEIATLLRRGDQLIASGDLAAARLVLQRAAEAGDARAALALAGTYDPAVLERLEVHGFASNIAMARAWYEKAQQFGSADAPRRLEVLASRRD